MAKKDTNDSLRFYQIAVDDKVYAYIFSLPVEVRQVMQRDLQKVLQKYIDDVHAGYDTAVDDD